MSWTWAAGVHKPRDDSPIGIVEVDNALVTPVARGPLRTERGPHTWVRGAVYDSDGVLVPNSQRRWQGDRSAQVAADPERVRVPRVARRLKGTWLYAGNWSNHFGHFILETLTNLWPDPHQHAASLTGILAHRPIGGPFPMSGRPVPLQTPDLKPWQRELLNLAGYGARDQRVVHSRPLKVERLLVPGRPVLLKRWALPPAVDVWRRVSDGVGRRGPHERIFLSRTRFHARRTDRARTDRIWDTGVDATFGAAGFHVVHPETMSVSEQIELIRGATVLAGPAGSALHLSAFADPGTRVLVVGDRRSPINPLPTQTIIDAACGHQTAFVQDKDEAGLASILAGIDAG